MSEREELVAAVRDGWPEHSKAHYPARGGFFEAPPVRDGGATARLIDYAVDVVLEATKPCTIGYVVVGNENNALDWDDQLYGTVDAAIGSLCSPYQPFDRDPESPNFWGKQYRICPVSEQAVAS